MFLLVFLWAAAAIGYAYGGIDEAFTWFVGSVFLLVGGLWLLDELSQRMTT